MHHELCLGDVPTRQHTTPHFLLNYLRLQRFNFNSQMECSDWNDTRDKRLLTSLRKSIVDKPPYINGTLQLPHSCFSIFYKIAKDGLAARFAP